MDQRDGAEATPTGGSGLPIPRRRTFATGIVPCAHSEETALRHPGCAGFLGRLSGHGQPRPGEAFEVSEAAQIFGHAAGAARAACHPRRPASTYIRADEVNNSQRTHAIGRLEGGRPGGGPASPPGPWMARRAIKRPHFAWSYQARWLQEAAELRSSSTPRLLGPWMAEQQSISPGLTRRNARRLYSHQPCGGHFPAW